MRKIYLCSAKVEEDDLRKNKELSLSLAPAYADKSEEILTQYIVSSGHNGMHSFTSYKCWWVPKKVVKEVNREYI